MGGFRWVHDQGSMEIMRTSDPAQLRRAWQTTNARMVELEGSASAMALEAERPEEATAFNDLGRASAGLRAAIESDVSLRSDPEIHPATISCSSRHRRSSSDRLDLNAALSNPVLRIQ